jgi:hypothetical protein
MTVGKSWKPGCADCSKFSKTDTLRCEPPHMCARQASLTVPSKRLKIQN